MKSFNKEFVPDQTEVKKDGPKKKILKLLKFGACLTVIEFNTLAETSDARKILSDLKRMDGLDRRSRCLKNSPTLTGESKVKYVYGHEDGRR